MTGHKRTGENPRENKGPYKRLVEGSPDIFYIYSTKRGFVYCSPRVESILGFKPAELTRNRRLWEDSIPPDDMDKIDQALKKALKGHGFNLEYRIKDTQGNWHWLHDRHLGTTIQKDEILIEGIASDITDRKKQERALQESHEALRKILAERSTELQSVHLQLLHAEKLNSLGKLAASIAHEFGNSIFGIRNMLQAINDHHLLAEDSMAFLDLAVQECNRMKNLLANLQSFNLPTKRTHVFMDLHENMGKMLLLCQEHLKARKIKVTCEYDHSIPGIYAIPDQIKQVLLNLLNNAEEAIPDSGGTIRITTRKIDDRIVVVRIEDSGKGITPETRPHIFKPFFSTKAEDKGSGLGLPLSHEIVTNHGGKIEVASVPGQGTTFSIFLPIDRRVPPGKIFQQNHQPETVGNIP